jgi:nitrate/nitrite-specific signal transduction histidine kinase
MAPADLVSQYGPERSYDRSADEVVSAISIRIPLGEAYASVNQLTLRLSALFAIVFIGLFAIVAFLNNRLVFIPLKNIRKKALQISTDPKHLGEQIDLPEGKELAELVIAFNDMSIQLFEDRTQLENRIDKRTSELKIANERLHQEIEERKQTISELEQTLNEVKILRGILPICSYCKKIRDDKGYWNQLELYLMEHSRAELSHSLCPECAKKYYPDMKLYDE